jgi:hypothetical protein
MSSTQANAVIAGLSGGNVLQLIDELARTIWRFFSAFNVKSQLTQRLVLQGPVAEREAEALLPFRDDFGRQEVPQRLLEEITKRRSS